MREQQMIDYSNGFNETMECLVRSVTGGNDFINFMDKYKDNLYIFGAGALGKNFESKGVRK